MGKERQNLGEEAMRLTEEIKRSRFLAYCLHIMYMRKIRKNKVPSTNG